jgi:hypothetical protein
LGETHKTTWIAVLCTTYVPATKDICGGPRITKNFLIKITDLSLGECMTLGQAPQPIMTFSLMNTAAIGFLYERSILYYDMFLLLSEIL